MSVHRVLMLSRSVPHQSIGGMEFVVWDLACELARQGIETTLLTTRIEGKPEEFEDGGVRVVAFADAPTGRYSRVWWRRSRQWFSDPRQQPVDLVLSVSAGGFALLPLRGGRRNVPFVMQAHGTSRAEIVSKWRSHRPRALASSVRNVWGLFKDMLAYRRFDAVVAIGETVRVDLMRLPISMVLPPERVHLIANGIDTRLFRPDADRRALVRAHFGIAPGERLVVSASRLHVQKGVMAALQAFALAAASDPRLRYVVVGDGPERTALEAAVSRLGLSDRVTLVGALPREQVAAHLQAADAFLFLSHHLEGLPLNILEALAVGLPVVLSGHLAQNLGITERLWPVDPRNPGAIARALSAALVVGPATEGLLPEQFTLSHAVRAYRALFDALRSGERH